MRKLEQESPGMERAKRTMDQAKARYEEEKRKANAKRRKAENHHKYMMGGIIVKYFPDCYQYEERELNEILSAALKTEECKAVIARVRAAAEHMEKSENGSGYADDGKTWNGGYSDNTKAESGGYANQKEKSMSGGDRYGQEM